MPRLLHLCFQCQLGPLPLGTGNDLARVLGWGNTTDDDTQLPSVIERFERAQTKMLDRWSILVYETPVPVDPRKVGSLACVPFGVWFGSDFYVQHRTFSQGSNVFRSRCLFTEMHECRSFQFLVLFQTQGAVAKFEDNVAIHLKQILQSSDHAVVLQSAK